MTALFVWLRSKSRTTAVIARVQLDGERVSLDRERLLMDRITKLETDLAVNSARYDEKLDALQKLWEGERDQKHRNALASQALNIALVFKIVEVNEIMREMDRPPKYIVEAEALRITREVMIAIQANNLGGSNDKSS